jgi:hypothetical protein
MKWLDEFVARILLTSRELEGKSFQLSTPYPQIGSICWRREFGATAGAEDASLEGRAKEDTQEDGRKKKAGNTQACDEMAARDELSVLPGVCSL